MPMPTPFNNLITFSRGSNATVTGPNGLIQYAPNNLITHSEQMDNAAWVKLNATVTANTATAPDGTISADKLAEDATAGVGHLISQGPTLTAVAHTYSAYAKAAERNWVCLLNNSVANAFAFFDLATGTIGTVAAGATASITNVGNGWYRCSITFTAFAGTNNCHIRLAPSDNVLTYNGVAGNGALVWGAQLELGSTATTYNPTTVKNLLGFSEAFDNAAWTKTNSSIVTGAQANPINGLFNAQKLMEGTATSRKTVQGSGAASSNQTFSVYVKPAGRNFVAIGQTNGAGLWAVSLFNLSTGAFTASYQAGGVATPTVNQITPVGSGWFRVSCFLNAGASAPIPVIMLGNGGDPIFEAYTGDGNSGVYIYGAQLSDSASLDPYVPTPGAAPSSTAFYGPRFDFDPVTLLPRGLLVEEQRTNLLLNSVFGGAVSGTPGTAPTSWGSFANGSIVVTSLGRNFAANSIRITTTSARHFYSQTVALAATGTWIITFKVNVGAAVRIDELLAFNTRPAGSTIQYFYNDAAQAASFVPPTGNGVLQVTVTTTGTSGNAEIRFGCGASNAVTADVTFWDAQWELGAFATSYIPTVASTVTRSADVATITGQNFAQWYRQDEGVIAADTSTFKPTAVGGSVIIAEANDNTLNNRNILFYTAADVRGRTAVAGVTQAEISQAYVANATDKLAYAYRVNDFAFARNGGLVGTDTTGTVPVVDRFMIGGVGASAVLNGHIRSIRFIPARAADFQLQGLTT